MTASQSPDWAGSLYRGLSVVAALLGLPLNAVTLVFGVLPMAA